MLFPLWSGRGGRFRLRRFLAENFQFLHVRRGEQEDAVRGLAVAPGAEKAPKLAAAIKAWESQVDALDRGEITPEEYESWKMGIGGC